MAYLSDSGCAITALSFSTTSVVPGDTPSIGFTIALSENASKGDINGTVTLTFYGADVTPETVDDCTPGDAVTIGTDIQIARGERRAFTCALPVTEDSVDIVQDWKVAVVVTLEGADGAVYTPVAQDAFIVLDERTKPTNFFFDAEDLSELNPNPYDYFGEWVIGKSKPRFSFAHPEPVPGFDYEVLDMRDPTNRIVEYGLRSVFSRGVGRWAVIKELKNTTGVFDVPFDSIDSAFMTRDCKVQICVTDKFGLTTYYPQDPSRGTTQRVWNYFPPVIKQVASANLAERWKTVDGTDIASNDGESVWFNLGLEIAVGGDTLHGNAYSITASYIDDMEETVSEVIRSGSDGDTLEVTHLKAFLDGDPFSVTRSYPFTLTVADYYSTVSFSGADILANKAYLDVERNGVAAGMLSTASTNNQKFESAYCGHFYEGIRGLSNFSEEEEQVGRWIDGRPIYSRVIHYATTITSSTSLKSTDLYDASNDGVDYFIDARGFIVNATYGVRTLPYYWSDTDIAMLNTTGSSKKVSLRSRVAQNITDVYLMLLYTKYQSGDILEITPDAYSASSEYSTSYPVKNLFDGDSSTSWMTKATGSTPVGYVSVQLPTNVNHITVSCWSRANSNGGAPSHVKAILGSENGIWDGDVAEANTDGAATTYKELCKLELNNTEVYPWLKIELTKGSKQGYAGFAEVVIKGTLI